ncbi:hypothetical protein [Brevibacillus borstelensis]|uniref:hypothetical protein n=1 Tax=Brevibacillus borstelensis TaxID=45462 RepID=UPI003CED9383
MAERAIVHANGFTGIHNAIMCCNRISGNGLKLLGLIMNQNNITKKNIVKMPRLLLRRIFDNCSDRTIENHADDLKKLGFIESYSRQGGDNGEFVFVIVDRPENNPYVLIGIVENDLLNSVKLRGNSGDFLRVIKDTIGKLEGFYVERLKHAASNIEREKIIDEYRQSLHQEISSLGFVDISIKQVARNPNTKNRIKEKALSDDILQWDCNDFGYYFTRKYKQVTGRNHPKKGINECIEKLLRHYRDTECKRKAKEHIDAFFENYTEPAFDPKVYLMSNQDALNNVERFLDTGKKHVPYELRSNEIKNKSEAKKEKDLSEAEHARKRSSMERFLRLMGDNNPDHNDTAKAL